MVKCIATSSRSSPWRRPESAAAFRSRSQNTRPLPTASWGRSKIGGERSKFLTRKPFRAFLTKANFLCSLKEETSGDKHGFVSQISDHSWKEMVAGMPQGRQMKRDESRWPCWHSGSENCEDFRRRRSTFSRISPRPLACLARPSALVRDIDPASAPLESTARKRSEASPLSEIPELHLKEEDLRVEQNYHWTNQKNDHADEPRMGHPVLKDENRQRNDGSFKEPNPYPSVEDSTRHNFSHEIEFSNLQGDERRKLVWEFACALAHAYLHQKDVEERLMVGVERPLPGPNRVVGQDFEMAKPWDEHVHLENEQEERENSACDRKTSMKRIFLSAGERDCKPTEKKAGVSGVHGLLRKRSELLMDEVVNPTQAAAWLGTHVTTAAAAVLASY